MEACRLALMDSDFFYNQAVMNYINMKSDIPITVMVFSDAFELMQYLEKNEVDYLLLDEAISDRIDVEIPTKILTEDRNKSTNNQYIYKYQNIPNICQNILQYTRFQNDIKTKGRAEFDAVFSVDDAAYKTKIIDKISRGFGNILLIHLNEFRMTGVQDEESELFIYYLLTNNESIVDIIERMVAQDVGDKRFFETYGPISYFDIKELKKSDIRWLKRLISQNQEKLKIEKIIVDIEGGVLSDLNVLFEFDKVYIPFSNNKDHVSRVDSFKFLIKDEVENAKNVQMIYMDMEDMSIIG